MPSENAPFTPSSILFRPRQNPLHRLIRRALVEAPGTAPGSDRFIATVIYRHSRRTGVLNIGVKPIRQKGPKGAGVVSDSAFGLNNLCGFSRSFWARRGNKCRPTVELLQTICN